MIGHSAANRAKYINAIQARGYSRNVDFCPTLALDFGLHVVWQALPIDEISGD